MNKKIIVLLLILGLILHINDVNASSGALRKNSIKTCPDGIVYGYHGSNGKTHWHKAVKSEKSSSGWIASGSQINDDPCPEPQKLLSHDIEDNVIKKSNNTSIEKIIIDEDEISDIKDVMEYKAINKSIKIDIILNDLKSKYEIIGDSSKIYSNKLNEFKIEITAEDGTIKDYILNVFRDSMESDTCINKFSINDMEIKFDENKKGYVEVESWIDEIKYSYDLSNHNARIVIYQNNKIINDIKPNQGNNDYKLEIIDELGDIKDYYLTIEKMSIIDSIVVNLLTIFMMLIPGLCVAAYLIIKSRK